MDHTGYGEELFPEDVRLFAGALPANDCLNRPPAPFIGIQHGMLTRVAGHMDSVPAARRAPFAVALYAHLLAKGVFERHYPESDPSLVLAHRFRFTGDCPGGCRIALPPRNALAAVNLSPSGEDRFPRKHLPIWDVFDDVFDAFGRTWRERLRERAPEIEPAEFWNRCLADMV